MSHKNKTKPEQVEAFKAISQQVANLETQLAEAKMHNAHLEAALITRKFEAEHAQEYPQDEITRFRLVQQLPIGVQIFDTDGLCVGVNEANLRIFGIKTPRQVIGRFNIFTDAPMAQQPGMVVAARQALAGRVVHLPEVLLNFDYANPELAKIERKRILSTTCFPVRNAQGEIVRLVILNEDITERKQAEAEHRLSDEILNQMPDAIVVTDMNGLVQRWTGMAAELFGYTAEEIIGQPINILNHPDVREAITQDIKKQIEETGHFLNEIPCVRKDGTEIPIEVRARIVYDAAGNPQGYISLNRDITERKKAENALREAEAKYRTLVEKLPAITYAVERSETRTITTYISPQVETILGFSQAEWLGNPNLWKEQLHPDDRAEVLSTIARCDSNNENLNLEYRSLTRDGRIIWFYNQTTNLEPGGTTRYIHGVMFDITQQKQLEEQLRQAQRMEAVGQMAGGIAHNFNNVLTALIGHTELALDTIPQEHPVRYDLEGIKKSALRAADLTQQLLAFTRRQNSQPRIIDLNELVGNISTMFRQIIGADIDLVVILEPELGRTKADADQIEQLLINLVVNARDAMPSGGKLTIKTGNITLTDTQPQLAVGDYALLSVTDTGVGMSKDVMAHIFEPFYTTKEGNQRTGLGLSTCFGIVKQNKGHILVESNPGKGTIFKVYLPCHAEEKTNITHQRHHALKLPTGTETILLVDDARLVREMSARVLRQQGYTVLEAADGTEALAIIKVHNGLALDLLITDVVMPQMGGDVLAKQVQMRYPLVKVLFISGHSHRKIASLGEAGLYTEILTKPFSPDVLSIKVRNLLDRAIGSQ